MEKSFEFGKIDYFGIGRRVNLVSVDVVLKHNTDGKPVFSVCGNIWNASRTDIVSGGQNLDEIAKYIKSPLFRSIFGMWKKHHLNDMHAGTETQERIVNKWVSRGNCYDYNIVCRVLNLCGILYDNGYKYGTKWLYREIPETDLKTIYGFFK